MLQKENYNNKNQRKKRGKFKDAAFQTSLNVDDFSIGTWQILSQYLITVKKREEKNQGLHILLLTT